MSSYNRLKGTVQTSVVWLFTGIKDRSLEASLRSSFGLATTRRELV
jgi:hypothetical protein